MRACITLCLAISDAATCFSFVHNNIIILVLYVLWYNIACCINSSLFLNTVTAFSYRKQHRHCCDTVKI